MNRQTTWNVLFLGCAVAALLLLASGLTGLAFQPGRPFTVKQGQVVVASPDGAPPESANASAIVSALLLACFVAIVAYLLFSVSSQLLKHGVPRGISRYVRLALLVLVLTWLLVALLLRFSAPGESPPLELPAQPPGLPLPSFTARPPWWLTLVLIGVVAVVLLVGIWYFWRRGRQRDNALVLVAQSAIANIQAGEDLHDTVLRCYRDMSQVLREQREIERDRATTPREFAEYLAATGLRDEHIQRLTRLFERVRYGGRGANEREAREAIDCLSAIVAAYGGD